jgi:hypothetical protein
MKHAVYNVEYNVGPHGCSDMGLGDVVVGCEDLLDRWRQYLNIEWPRVLKGLMWFV